MLLKNLHIINFKMFEDLNLQFKPGFNLILGDNGVGKTSVLEAATVAVSGFLTGMEDIPTRNIYKDDIHYNILVNNNGTFDRSYCYPVEIESTISYAGTDYTWDRTKISSRTMISPKDILKVSRDLINSTERKILPLISYQSASRHWISARKDANEKKRKQLHNRRCGYLGCLDRTANLNVVNNWCEQMEWSSVRMNSISENYEQFGKIVSKFMSIMNDGLISKVVYQPNEGKILYSENGEFKDIDDLSAGYQSLLNLILDLAYRMAILNPDEGENISKVEGIVFIDEIDSNLHPKWQWRVVDAFCRKLSSNNTKWNRSSASGSNASHCEGVGMLGDITAADEIYIVTGRTDMRKSIDGLCAIVEDQLHMDPRRSALYLFCGKRCDRIKALLWESDGFVLLYKRMEVQGRFRWPRNQLEVKQLTWQQFDWLMSGLEIEQPKAFKPTE